MDKTADATPNRTRGQLAASDTRRATHEDQEQAKPVNGTKSTPQTVLDFIQENPVVAAGGAFAVGCAVAMIVRSQKAQAGRLDRRVARLARNMDRRFSREMRNLRTSDFAERAGRFGNSLGDALSRIDLAPLAERGHAYLDAIASRVRR